MNELERRATEASAELHVELDAGSIQRLRSQVGQRLAARRRSRMAGYAGALLVVGGLSARLLLPASTAGVAVTRGAASARSTSGASQLVQVLRDGSQIERFDAATVVRVLDEAPELVRVELAVGQARFRITPNRSRRFVVNIDTVEVDVVGTIFELTRTATSLEVRVQEGRVAVRTLNAEVLLSGGETRTFALGVGMVAALASGEEPAQPAPSSSSGAASASKDWRRLARAGRFAQAYAVMPASTATSASASVDELLLRADVARLSGHPAVAIEPLRALLARYGNDSRAPSASFTLGRVYEQLGRLAEAAGAFAKTRALQPTGPLAEDALAREVLALLGAGNRVQAETRARQYLASYPHGVLAQEIRRRTGLP
jgi:transmembrane sensor